MHNYDMDVWSELSVNEWMNECLTTPQHENHIDYWVSEKGKCNEYQWRSYVDWCVKCDVLHSLKLNKPVYDVYIMKILKNW